MVRRPILNFKVGDVEDPDWYANMRISAWATENPEAHQYLLDHSTKSIRIERKQCEYSLGHSYELSVEMTEEDWFIYLMRFETCTTT